MRFYASEPKGGIPFLSCNDMVVLTPYEMIYPQLYPTLNYKTFGCAVLICKFYHRTAPTYNHFDNYSSSYPQLLLFISTTTPLYVPNPWDPNGRTFIKTSRKEELLFPFLPFIPYFSAFFLPLLPLFRFSSCFFFRRCFCCFASSLFYVPADVFLYARRLFPERSLAVEAIEAHQFPSSHDFSRSFKNSF